MPACYLRFNPMSTHFQFAVLEVDGFGPGEIAEGVKVLPASRREMADAVFRRVRVPRVN